MFIMLNQLEPQHFQKQMQTLVTKDAEVGDVVEIITLEEVVTPEEVVIIIIPREVVTIIIDHKRIKTSKPQEMVYNSR